MKWVRQAGALIGLLLCSQVMAGAQEISFWQKRIESRFTPWGLVLNRSLRDLTQVSGEDDSALWSGVYLASQCFRHRTEPDAALFEISRTLNAIELLFGVTGKPGNMARFWVDPIEARLSGIHSFDFDPDAEPYKTIGWRKTQDGSGRIWFGSTSRDQFSGFFFGMAVCAQEVGDVGVQERVGTLTLNAARAIQSAGWRVPNPSQFDYSKQTLHVVDLELKMAWAAAGAKYTTDPKEKEQFENAIRDASRALLWKGRAEIIPIPDYNNFLEYYAWNLKHLGFYTYFTFTDESRRAINHHAKKYIAQRVWPYVWDHQNPEFTWIKFSTLGFDPSDKKDARAMAEARASIENLMGRLSRNDQLVDSSSALGKAFEKHHLAGLVSRLRKIAKQDSILSFLFKLNPYMADRPLPLSYRPDRDYLWQHNPMVYKGGAKPPSFEYPAVDLLLAYWMGRAQGWVEN